MAGDTFQSLRHRNFRLFFVGQLISNVGNWLTNVALLLLVLRITDSGLDVGVLTACQFGPMLFLSAFGGVLADRGDKRRLLLVTQSLEMGQSVALAIVAFLPHPPLLSLFVLALAGGVLLAFDNPLRRSFVPEMVPREDLPNAVVLYSTIVGLSQILGPPLAGALAVAFGFGWCFTLDAATYLAVLAALVMMRPGELHRPATTERSKGTIGEALRYLWSVKAVALSFALFGVVGLFSFNFRVMLPLFVTRTLSRGELVFTILYALTSLGGVASAMLIASRKLVELRHVVMSAALLGLTLLLVGAMPNVYAAGVAVFLVGMASMVFSTSATAIVQVATRGDMHGRLLSLQTALLGGIALAGGPLIGAIADRLGGRAPLFLGGAVCLAAAAFGLLASRGIVAHDRG